MYSRENRLGKKAWNQTSSTTSNPFLPRPFGIQAKSRQSTSLQKDADVKVDRQSPNGFDFLNIPIHQSGTEAPSPIQPKLTIGQPGDKYEQEADNVAAQVVSQINSPSLSQSNQGAVAQRQTEEKEEEIQAKSIGQAQPEILQRSDINLLSRISIFEPGTAPPAPIQTKPFGQAESETTAQPDLETSIQQARGNGQPLADTIRQPMEKAMGADFSGVRVHTDAQSDQLNRSIQAKAFTTGQDVFFRQGAYEPGSLGGQELIAHELTHVVQQRGEMVLKAQEVNPPTMQQHGNEGNTLIQGRFLEDMGKRLERANWQLLGVQQDHLLRKLLKVIGNDPTHDLVVSEGRATEFDPNTKVLYLNKNMMDGVDRAITEVKSDQLDNKRRQEVISHIAAITHELSHAHDKIFQEWSMGTWDEVMRTELRAWAKEVIQAYQMKAQKGYENVSLGIRESLLIGWKQIDPSNVLNTKTKTNENELYRRIWDYIERGLSSQGVSKGVWDSVVDNSDNLKKYITENKKYVLEHESVKPYIQ